MLSVLAELYLARGRSGRPPAEPDQRAVIELMFDRARAQATTAPVRFVFDAFSTFRKLRAVDPRSIERSGGMYAGMVGPLSFSGLSFSFARRFLALAEPLVRREDVTERFLFELMRFVHGHVAGEWDEALRDRARGRRRDAAPRRDLGRDELPRPARRAPAAPGALRRRPRADRRAREDRGALPVRPGALDPPRSRGLPAARGRPRARGAAGRRASTTPSTRSRCSTSWPSAPRRRRSCCSASSPPPPRPSAAER